MNMQQMKIMTTSLNTLKHENHREKGLRRYKYRGSKTV